MLQQTTNPPLEVVWEKGILASRFGAKTVQKSSTHSFPLNHATVRTYRLHDGHNASVGIYYDREIKDQGRRRCVASLYFNDKGEARVNFNGNLVYEDLQDMARCVQHVRDQLGSLKS
jgi:hypothetical protein